MAEPTADNPRVMLITGTRKGIGRFLVGYYLDRGWHVVGCSRDASDLQHDRYTHHLADVADEKAMQAMFADVGKRFGRLDALINNAGIASMNHFVLTPTSTVRNILNTNVIGTFIGCREAVKLMMRNKNKAGRIINFATVAAPLDLEGEAAYAASKAAVEKLTRILAREVAPFGITVNAVGPTPVETDLIRNVPKAKMDALLDRHPIRRFGTFDDIVNVIDFFLQPGSDFITGQTLYLGGV
ncbi:MAG: SDR family oxidoreductase [Phycisphaera sp.]|nr:SDR family oxidoreductase [Phycisphaera sp.]